jgi:penicillin-binding protein-related factor A (putative recombinase)
MKSKMTEKQIETLMLSWLNSQRGVFAFKVNTVGVYDEAKKSYRVNRNRFVVRGTSDIIGCCEGIFFSIEVKTPKTIKSFENLKSAQKTTFHQKNFMNLVKDKGMGHAIVACDLESVKNLITDLKLNRVSL